MTSSQFHPTIKQSEALLLLEDFKHREILFGGGAGGCFSGDTLVRTISGLKKIMDVRVGDVVLSFDEKKLCLVWKPILETFKYGCSREGLRVVRLRHRQGGIINATTNHLFLSNTGWVEIGKLARRRMENHTQEWSSVRDQQQRKAQNAQLEEFRNNENHESREESERLLKNSHSDRGEEETSHIASSRGMVVHPEPREEDSSQSQRLQHYKQFVREFGMGNTQREFLLRIRASRTDAKDEGEHGESCQPQGISWNGECDEQVERFGSSGDSSEVQASQGDAGNACAGVWCEGFDDQGCGVAQELEAHRIKEEDILYARILESDEVEWVYDLCVADTHTYTITKHDLIVHNSKSFLACFWLLSRCVAYPQTRYLLGRAILKDIKQSTLNTFFDVARILNMQSGKHYSYNDQQSKITFSNKSEIYLKDLFAYPSDPNFDSLGSTEYTGAAIDEGTQVSEKAYNIVSTRIRYRLDEYGLFPKVLVCSNPAKNWMYHRFYKPSQDGSIAPHRAFVQALAKDNPYISKYYIEGLEHLRGVDRERLLLGNWEYADDLAQLLKYDEILSIFSNSPRVDKGYKYLSVDVARLGSDKTVIILWQDYHILKIYMYEKVPTDYTVRQIHLLCRSEGIPHHRVVVDEDGVGGGVKDQLEAVRGFVNNSRALPEKGEVLNFRNLKAQCAYKMADAIKRGIVSVSEVVRDEFKDMIISDLEQYRRKDPDKDQPITLVGKDEVREKLGRSPDVGDSILMRFVFDLEDADFTFIDGAGSEYVF